MNDKKLLKIILGLLIAVFIHNLYLNYEVLQVKEEALQVKEDAERARRYARDAADYASDAADNAFANNCRYCP